ncbi:MAG: EamA family transporter [Pseudomonadota bacterium]
MTDLASALADVSPAVWGILSALAFGTADFLARFTSRKIGHFPALFIVLVLGASVFVPLLLLQNSREWSAHGLIYVGLHGVLLAGAMALLYLVLARGPINVVAPIIAAHPAFIILIAFVSGSRPSAMQWLLMLAILVCIGVITRIVTNRANESAIHNSSEYFRRTLWLSLATSIVYALNVVAAQRAVVINGEIATVAIGHCFAIGALLFVREIRYAYASIPFKWWGVLLFQGVLNAAGMLFLFAGSFGLFPEVTALLSSEFSVVTILLAAIFLRERMTVLQLLAVVGVFTATGYLSLI